MRKIIIPENQTGMDAVGSAIMERFLDKMQVGDEYLVQMLIRKSDSEKTELQYRDITELVLVDRPSSFDGFELVWDNDWWEGEEDIILLAVANIRDIDITESFPFV